MPSSLFSFVSREDEGEAGAGRLGGGRGILVVDESLHGRRRERERRGQGQAVGVVHFVVYGHWTEARPPWRSRGAVTSQ